MKNLANPTKDHAESTENNLPSVTPYSKSVARYAAMYEDTVSDEEGSSS